MANSDTPSQQQQQGQGFNKSAKDQTLDDEGNDYDNDNDFDNSGDDDDNGFSPFGAL